MDNLLTAMQSRSYLYEGLVYQDFLNQAVQFSNSEIGYFHLYNEEEKAIQLAVWSTGVFPICTTVHTSHYNLKDAGIWADAVRQRQPVIHNDYERYSSKQGLPTGHFPLFRHLSLPIFYDGKIAAILGVGNSPVPYSQVMVNQLVRFCQKGYEIIFDKVKEIEERRRKQISLAHTDTISLLVNMVSCLTSAVALRDEYTARHAQNVGDLVVGIGQQLHLGEDTLLGLKLGALVHDIGKIAIPVEILTKPGHLNSAEYNLIKTHVVRGAEVFSSMKFPWSIVEMILQHHERLDGSGYPSGLHGEFISLEARIIAVADVFDSMSSNRPYRYAPGMEKAISELKKGRDLLYDPYVVDALLLFLEQVDEEFFINHHYVP